MTGPFRCARSSLRCLDGTWRRLSNRYIRSLEDLRDLFGPPTRANSAIAWPQTEEETPSNLDSTPVSSPLVETLSSRPQSSKNHSFAGWLFISVTPHESVYIFCQKPID